MTLSTISEAGVVIKAVVRMNSGTASAKKR